LRAATNTRKVPALSRRIGQATLAFLFCLAPHGVFRAPGLASGAVGSYPAFSPLPSSLRWSWRSILCDTIRRSRLSPPPPARSTRHAALWCPDFPLPEALRFQRATVRHHVSTYSSSGLAQAGKSQFRMARDDPLPGTGGKEMWRENPLCGVRPRAPLCCRGGRWCRRPVGSRC
jgi:hypothetical protein